MHKNKTINFGRKMMKNKQQNFKQRVKHIAPNHIGHTPSTCK